MLTYTLVCLLMFLFASYVLDGFIFKGTEGVNISIATKVALECFSLFSNLS